jgi:hypothetical protein
MDVLSLAIDGVRDVGFGALRICIPAYVFAVNCFFYYSSTMVFRVNFVNHLTLSP